MNTLAIFILGFFVSAITFAAAILTGLSEAADPNTRVEDLTALERKLVDRPELSARDSR